VNWYGSLAIHQSANLPIHELSILSLALCKACRSISRPKGLVT
jgi:hypothetical protein